LETASELPTMFPSDEKSDTTVNVVRALD